MWARDSPLDSILSVSVPRVSSCLPPALLITSSVREPVWKARASETLFRVRDYGIAAGHHVGLG